MWLQPLTKQSHVHSFYVLLELLLFFNKLIDSVGAAGDMEMYVIWWEAAKQGSREHPGHIFNRFRRDDVMIRRGNWDPPQNLNTPRLSGQLSRRLEEGRQRKCKRRQREKRDERDEGLSRPTVWRSKHSTTWLTRRAHSGDKCVHTFFGVCICTIWVSVSSPETDVKCGIEYTWSSTFTHKHTAHTQNRSSGFLPSLRRDTTDDEVKKTESRDGGERKSEKESTHTQNIPLQGPRNTQTYSIQYSHMCELTLWASHKALSWGTTGGL